MPRRAVYVGRPTIFGNPWKPSEKRSLKQCLKMYRHLATYSPLILKAIEALKGKDLACWCPLDQPCHADILLELANQ